MKIPKFLEDLSVISKLGDNPGADNGLTAEGLKAKFDEAALKLQGFINDTLIEKINSLFSADAPPHEGMNMTGPINMNQNKLGGLADPVEDGDAVNLGFANENYRGSDWLPSVEEIGAASAGYGYGEPMVWLGLKDGTVTDTFQADLEALYASMPSGTCKQVQLADKSTFVNQKYCGTLWKYTPNFGVLTAANYGGFKVIKRIEDGQWEPWAIDNPNNALGGESTTSEFWNRATVYRKIISVGKLPNNSEMSLTVEGASKIVSVNGYITNDKYDIPIFAPNSGISNMYFAKSSKLLYITTGSDRSTWDCYLDVKYTK